MGYGLIRYATDTIKRNSYRNAKRLGILGVASLAVAFNGTAAQTQSEDIGQKARDVFKNMKTKTTDVKATEKQAEKTVENVVDKYETKTVKTATQEMSFEQWAAKTKKSLQVSRTKYEAKSEPKYETKVVEKKYTSTFSDVMDNLEARFKKTNFGGIQGRNVSVYTEKNHQTLTLNRNSNSIEVDIRPTQYTVSMGGKAFVYDKLEKMSSDSLYNKIKSDVLEAKASSVLSASSSSGGIGVLGGILALGGIYMLAKGNKGEDKHVAATTTPAAATPAQTQSQYQSSLFDHSLLYATNNGNQGAGNNEGPSGNQNELPIDGMR